MRVRSAACAQSAQENKVANAGLWPFPAPLLYLRIYPATMVLLAEDTNRALFDLISREPEPAIPTQLSGHGGGSPPE